MSCDTEQTTWRCGRRGQLAVLAALVMLVISCQGSTTNDEQQAGGGGAADDQIGGSTSEAGVSTYAGQSDGGFAGAATTSGGIGGSGGAEGPVGGSSSAGGAGSIPCPETVPGAGESCTQLCQYVDCEGIGITVVPCVDGLTVYRDDPIACEPFDCRGTECAGNEVCVELYSQYSGVPSYGCYPYPCDDPGLFTDDCAQQICDSTVIYPYLAVNVINGPRGVSCYMSM